MSKWLFTIPSSPEAYRISDDIFGAVVDSLDIDISERSRIKLIISELFMNAYLHGNKSDPDKDIELSLEFSKDLFTAIVKDQGPGISKAQLEKSVNFMTDLEKEGGRGIGIISKMSDNVDFYKDENDRFCVKITKKIGGQEENSKSVAGNKRGAGIA